MLQTVPAMIPKKDYSPLIRDLEKVQDKHIEELVWFYPPCPKCEQRIPLTKVFMGPELLCQNCNTSFKLIELGKTGKQRDISPDDPDIKVAAGRLVRENK